MKNRLLREFDLYEWSEINKTDRQKPVGTTSSSRSSTQPPPLFCSAPWLEATIRIDGGVYPCCRSKYLLGNLENESLTSIWASASAKKIRKSIRKGILPDDDCAMCFHVGTNSTLNSTFSAVLGQYWARYCRAINAAGQPLSESLWKTFSNFHSLVKQADPSAIARQDIAQLSHALHRAETKTTAEFEKQILHKLKQVVRASSDFILGKERPRIVATFRQVNLVSICNARCIHCLGNINQEVARGTKIRGKRHKFMTGMVQSKAMGHSEHITRFYMNGSEFFLFKNHIQLLREFTLNQIYFSVSTNGMLLTPNSTDALLDSQCLSSINVSFDGATRQTVEKIRHGVRYATLLGHTRYLLKAMDKRSVQLPVSLSMVLLRDNIEEVSNLVRLASQLRNGLAIDIHVSLQVLEQSPSNEYQAFRKNQSLDVRDEQAFRQLAKAANAGDELGVGVYYGPNQQLRDALAQVAL